MGKLVSFASIALFCVVVPCAYAESGGYPAQYRVSVETLDNGTTVESFRWGDLTVAFEEFVDERYASTARVIDASGTTLLELRSARFITPSLTDGGDDFTREFFLDLFGDGEQELKLTAWSGGAYGSYVDMLYSYDERDGLKNLLSYAGGEGRLGKGSDDLSEGDELNAIAQAVLRPSRDGRVPFLVLADYGLHSLGGQTHGSVVFVVLRWHKDRYLVANEEYPEISGLAIERYQKRIEDEVGFDTDLDLLSPALVSAIVGYLSNAAMIGRYDAALAWVRERLVGTTDGSVSLEKKRSLDRLRAEYFDRAKDAPRQIRESIDVDQRPFRSVK